MPNPKGYMQTRVRCQRSMYVPYFHSPSSFGFAVAARRHPFGTATVASRLSDDDHDLLAKIRELVRTRAWSPDYSRCVSGRTFGCSAWSIARIHLCGRDSAGRLDLELWKKGYTSEGLGEMLACGVVEESWEKRFRGLSGHSILRRRPVPGGSLPRPVSAPTHPRSPGRSPLHRS